MILRIQDYNFNNERKANIFSKFFSSVQVVEKDGCPNIERHKLNEEMPKLNISSREKVLKILKELKPNKAAGIDNISSRVLKEVAEEIVDIIVMIFNESISNIKVPRSWRLVTCYHCSNF